MGPDPAQTLALETGEWSIRILIASLAITPLRYLLKMPRLWSYRRMIGLFALHQPAPLGIFDVSLAVAVGGHW